MSLRPLVATGSQTIGPFFHVGPGATHRFGHMADAGTRGEHIELRIRVLDGDGAPVPDAMIELWQADANGAYSLPSSGAGASPPPFAGFGRLPADSDGWCTFETIRPGAVGDGAGRRQAPHVNVCLFARGLLRHVYTRIYFEDDPGLSSDPLLSLVPPDRVTTLVARRPRADASTPSSSGGTAIATWEFVIRLQGENETVFFDV